VMKIEVRENKWKESVRCAGERGKLVRNAF
jgi:hypothetical protein